MKSDNTYTIAGICLAIALLLAAPAAQAERIKDIVDIQGVRGNPLWGYGLVVGLAGTGDDSEVSRRAMANLLRRKGLVLNPADVASKNIASVLVTADLGPFNRKGSKINVTVSAIGSAASLLGGTLLLTDLQGADGNTYAVSQGQLVIGGFSASGEAANVSKNHPTVARITNGATVEREELAEFVEKGRMVLSLKNGDFTTAERIAKAINVEFPAAAVAEDAGNVRVDVPRKYTKAEISKFVDSIGALEVQVDYPAVVVINEKTGAIVIGENVKVSIVAISLGSLTIVKSEKPEVSQPGAFAPKGAETVKVPRSEIETNETPGSLKIVPRNVSVAELAHALNAMGLTARELITIFQELHDAGALQAELKTN